MGESQCSSEYLSLQSKTSSLQNLVMKRKFKLQSLNTHILQAEKRLKHFESLDGESYSKKLQRDEELKKVSDEILNESKKHDEIKKHISGVQAGIRKCRWRKVLVRAKIDMYHHRGSEVQKEIEKLVGQSEKIRAKCENEHSTLETK